MDSSSGNIAPVRFRARVLRNEMLSRGVRGIVLSAKSSPDWSFRAGQYVKVFLSTTEPKPEVRYYSIASEPERLPEIELAIKAGKDEKGFRFWESIRPDAEVELEGPQGKLGLCADSGRQRLFVAMGTGITPLRSMIRHLLLGKKSEVPAALYFGFREEADLFWNEEFSELARFNSKFRYVPTLSKPGPDWKGERGRVTDLLVRDFPSAKLLDAYVCGSPAMVEETLALLAKLGLDPQHAHRE